MVLSPLTGTSEVALLKTFETEKLIEGWQSTFGIDIREEFRGVTTIYLYQCSRTKLNFFQPDAAMGSDKLYEQLEAFDWYYIPDKWEHKVAIGDLKGCSKVLEVGCGFGEFVRRLRNDCGIDALGLELNQSAVAIGKKNGIPILPHNLADFSLQHPSTFDAVCGFQVLEHVNRPREFIESALKLLKPGGKLIFCVPNAGSFLRHTQNLLDMPPHHMLRWSIESFESLQNLFPLRLDRIKLEPLAAYHIDYYLNAQHGRFLKSNPLLSRLFFNRFTLTFLRRGLLAGGRKFYVGQSLYAVLRKIS